MTYLEYLNKALGQYCKTNDVVMFGQNVNNGSRIDGLTRGVESKYVYNSTNCENTLVGVGMGLMMEGLHSIFFMKQLDFLILGLDHLVNTYNIIRIDERLKKGSFTLFPIIVDADFQGPQSSFNNLADICSMSNIHGYTLNTQAEVDFAVNTIIPGNELKVVTVSKRLFGKELVALAPAEESKGGFYCYHRGKDVSILCFNFSLPYGIELRNALSAGGVEAGIFNIYDILFNPEELSHKLDGKPMIILDDSKSIQKPYQRLLAHLGGRYKFDIIERQIDQSAYAVGVETLKIDYGFWVSKVRDNYLKRDINGT